MHSESNKQWVPVVLHIARNIIEVESQKEGQKDQGEVKELDGVLPSSFTSPWVSWASFWLWARWQSIKPPYLTACKNNIRFYE